MTLLSIGQAAQRLGLTTSALRYYDERGLAPPRARHRGRRMYGSDELRRLAFLKLANRLGLPLDAVAAVLDDPSPHWRHTVREQIADLDQLIARAQMAQTLLKNLLDCPTEHPATDCSVMIEALDRLAAGGTMDELAADYT